MTKQKLRLGTVAFSPKGKWNAETEYKRLNVVHFLASSYYAKKDNVGQTPALDSEYWGLLVEGGDVVNNPDEEDITTEVVNNEHVLKLADKEYRPEKFSGKGYKRLRKNIQKIDLAVTKITVNSAPTKDGEISITINNIDTHISLVNDTHNTPALVAQAISDALVPAHTDYDIEVIENIITLTRKHSGEVAASAFDVADTEITLVIEDSAKFVMRNLLIEEMINQSNTIYEIMYDFDLNEQEITIPEGCILDFQGGSLNNGTIHFNDTYIKGTKLIDCTITGNYFYKENADEEDITSIIENNTQVLKFKDRVYSPSDFSGKGYKILRKNIVNGINILTRNMVSEANTVYIVKYDFTINSYTPLPSNVSFIFDGGSFYAPSRSKIIRSKQIEGTSVGELIHLYGRVGNSVRAFYQEEIMVNDIGFINVVDYGIDNRGAVDVTEKLNQLFTDFARGVPYYSSLVFYFPKGTYLISDTLIVKGVNQTILGESISNSKTSFINDGTIFKYIGESGTFCFSYEKGTNAGCNFKNITLISEGCTVNRKVIETEEDIWNGTNAQHFILYNETKPNIGAIELQHNKWIDNCLIYGFSNCAIKTSIFNKIDNTYITNCNTGILIENTDYKADTIIDNCYISYCKKAIICNNATLVRNCWIDEIAEYAIYNNYKDDKYALTLEMHSTHINHIDYAGIYGRFDRVHISGCTLNRCGCYYAGYKYSNVPKEDKSKCSTLYILRCYYAIIEFNQSGLEMLDSLINGNKGGHCSVVPIIFAGDIHNIYINVSGRSNEMIPVINENNSEIIDSYIIYNGKRYDINKKCFIDEKGNDINTKYNGTIEQRPTDINIGFQYFDTTLNKPIWWTGTKWVNATGTDV